MAFRGPGSGAGFSGVSRLIDLYRQQELDAFDQDMQRASLSMRAQPARISEADGGSPWIERSVSDALPMSRTRVLEQAALAGEAEATREGSAQQVRLAQLQRIPGVTPRMASRMVLGRTGVQDEGDPSELRAALAEYLRRPSRETAAAAVSVGANLNQFPDRFAGDPGYAVPPVRGTPEFEQMLRREGDIQADVLERTAPIRANATAATRATTRDRVTRATLEDGTIVSINLDTGEMRPVTGASGEPARAPKTGKVSLLDQMLNQPADGVRAAPANAPAAADTGNVEAEQAAFMAAYRRLRARGVKNITGQMVRAEMTNDQP